MPAFNESKDDLDAYMMRFERVEEGQKWPKEQWATALSMCLSGKALSVFGRLPATECTEYSKLKEALLKRFRMTEDGFREKFKTAKSLEGETPAQYIARLDNYWCRWLELSNTKKEYEEVKVLMLREQFLSQCEPGLAVFLRERKDKSLQELAERAEQYMNARGHTNLCKKPTGREKVELSAKPFDKQDKANGKKPSKESRACFLCGCTGHIAAECRSFSGSGQFQKCTKCGKRGHLSWKCRSTQEAGTKAGTAKEAASVCIEKGYVELKDGQKREFSKETGVLELQLVVPKRYRVAVLQLAHEGLLAGHLGCRKTEERILTSFYWPGVVSDVKKFVKSCAICQRTTPKGKTRKVPLEKVPVIGTPFHRVAIDIVGPLFPRTQGGNRCILTMVDYATRHPDAVALPSIETERVAEALVSMFSRVGIPREILSDRGSSFTSEVMKEVSRLLSVKQLHTTPYHPMANGLVEKFNGTLKSMLKKTCQERPKDWDRYLEALLFAYREVPQESLGFSPFELFTSWNYGTETCKLAHEELQRAGARYKKFYDKSSKKRELQPGDNVLILLPTDHNKLLMQWKGPFEVLAKKSEVDYEIGLDSGGKLFHINLLKKYEERDTEEENSVDENVCVVVTAEEEENETLHLLPTDRTETNDVKIGPTLTPKQRVGIQHLLSEFPAIFSDIPGKTNLTECDFGSTTNNPVNTKQYPLPFAVRETIEEEVQNMLRLGIIEKSNSPYNSPVLVVRKQDGTHRLCVDFRRLNDVLIFDCEAVPRADELLATVGNRTYFSKLDFTKGYWQIPLSEAAKPKTAFSTSTGLYQFCFMPFGLKTAPAAFTKLMRKLLSDIDGVVHYYDDVLVATATWHEHLAVLRQVFQRVQSAGLTVKPTKCELGSEAVDFLGHRIGNGVIAPLTKTLEKIQNVNRLQTKRQVRSFLGLAGYYRNFIPRYSEFAAPLSDLTKKGKPNKVTWETQHESAFQELKKHLSRAPVLRLPDFEKEFVLCTDASDRSIGDVLQQEHDGVLQPVSYASRKLLPREAAYVAIEREGLALLWGVQTFTTYLYGKPFTIQTDHEPLLYINKQRHLNNSVLRWSLQLQEYSFRVQYVKGSENRVADYSSRIQMHY
ncbi:uncharacterized protein LOC135389103 [Ornithodoros turicata]|uniref:uncharacterized protein LOC135389103 n=1 Tax=Ornithodoros turicata TaxID=34597 RepID=UPI0031394E35